MSEFFCGLGITFDQNFEPRTDFSLQTPCNIINLCKKLHQGLDKEQHWVLAPSFFTATAARDELLRANAEWGKAYQKDGSAKRKINFHHPVFASPNDEPTMYQVQPDGSLRPRGDPTAPPLPPFSLLSDRLLHDSVNLFLVSMNAESRIDQFKATGILHLTYPPSEAIARLVSEIVLEIYWKPSRREEGEKVGAEEAVALKGVSEGVLEGKLKGIITRSMGKGKGEEGKEGTLKGTIGSRGGEVDLVALAYGRICCLPSSTSSCSSSAGDLSSPNTSAELAPGSLNTFEELAEQRDQAWNEEEESRSLQMMGL
ncbi:hypothetical protein BCR35DRAFT_100619 [Leucosporidium creatinivorum]|uniref:Uncharacterized protein n=1 Tax=Leucosporidium creatinivorum TaxID=106004 RepID=A0A1Y2F6F2_9BASI|nr:hypothetical protein BCR35DRAFT_100619 [Leucosporidium creatinivorum]